MLRKTIQFENLDGEIVQRTLYFNIATNELVDKELASGETFSKRLEAIKGSNKLSEVYPLIIEFMQDGYGVRTEDGDFVKSPEEWTKFKDSLAYSALMEDLLFDENNNGQKVADFFRGMLPAAVGAAVDEANAVPGFRPGADTSRPTPPGAHAATQQPPVALGEVPATVVPDNTGYSTPAADAVAPEAPVPASSFYPVAPESAPVVEAQQTSEPRDPRMDFVNGGTTTPLNPDGVSAG